MFQVSDPKEVFSGKRVTDKPLSEDQMMGETLALVLGDSKIWAAGTYWQRNKFTNRTLFAPYAYKSALNSMSVKMEDLARLNSTGELFVFAATTYLKAGDNSNNSVSKYQQ